MWIHSSIVFSPWLLREDEVEHEVMQAAHFCQRGSRGRRTKCLGATVLFKGDLTPSWGLHLFAFPPSSISPVRRSSGLQRLSFPGTFKIQPVTVDQPLPSCPLHPLLSLGACPVMHGISNQVSDTCSWPWGGQWGS